MSERRESSFEKWAEQEGIPLIRGYSVENLYQVPLGKWERKGGLGALIILEGGEGRTSAYVCEIPPHTSLKPQRHLFEEQIYILNGHGETTMWVDGVPCQSFAWQEYGLFAVPVNVWHQHKNTSDRPARYVAITDAPLVFNLYRNQDFIFNCSFVFKDRYAGDRDYFDGMGKFIGEDLWEGGFIRNIRELDLQKSIYGKGHRRLGLCLSKNSWGAHVGGIEVGGYKKAHRHQGGAHIIIAEGTGYAAMWQDGGEMKKLNFQKGSIYSPPEGWWHTHFNTGTEVVLQVAFRTLAGKAVGKNYHSRISVKKGGDMLELEDEDPEIRRVFEEELSKKGIKCTMPEVRKTV